MSDKTLDKLISTFKTEAIEAAEKEANELSKTQGNRPKKSFKRQKPKKPTSK